MNREWFANRNTLINWHPDKICSTSLLWLSSATNQPSPPPHSPAALLSLRPSQWMVVRRHGGNEHVASPTPTCTFSAVSGLTVSESFKSAVMSAIASQPCEDTEEAQMAGDVVYFWGAGFHVVVNHWTWLIVQRQSNLCNSAATTMSGSSLPCALIH